MERLVRSDGIVSQHESKQFHLDEFAAMFRPTPKFHKFRRDCYSVVHNRGVVGDDKMRKLVHHDSGEEELEYRIEVGVCCQLTFNGTKELHKRSYVKYRNDDDNTESYLLIDCDCICVAERSTYVKCVCIHCVGLKNQNTWQLLQEYCEDNSTLFCVGWSL